MRIVIIVELVATLSAPTAADDSLQGRAPWHLIEPFTAPPPEFAGTSEHIDLRSSLPMAARFETADD
ncbi:MAG TPA: hypothetical protein VHC22_29615 [Pirellulales bacterium]|nr:hypothetical protein [Pirellulales bacterium]